MKKRIALAGLVMSCVFLFTTVDMQAAPKTMADGTVFDAEFYAETYPDVKDAVGSDETALYDHYVNYGKAEGRKPVADTNTVADGMCWKSATGKKYHSIDHCGKMNPKKAKQITIEEAKKEGLQACGKCW